MPKINGVPYVAFGNDELGDPITAGDSIGCPHCGGAHVVTHGTNEQGEESSVLQFYKCGRTTYLIGINQRRVPLPRKEAPDG